MYRLLVVPRKTSYTPPGAWVGEPDLFAPSPKLVEISVVFTWDKKEAERLVRAWRDRAGRVEIGGPAYGDPGGEFEPGRYVKKGITITSRGCPKRCSWCYVPTREGKLRELTIKPGRIVNDNNLLACSRKHIEKVFQMLEGRGRVEFKGGLDPMLLKDWHVRAIAQLRTNEVFLAYDSAAQRKHSLRAIEMFRIAGFQRWKIRCYLMIGYREDRVSAEKRIRETYLAGATPFVQLYDKLRGDKEWRAFTRLWTRIPILKARIDHPREEKK